jgi:hypothetical protein
VNERACGASTSLHIYTKSFVRLYLGLLLIAGCSNSAVDPVFQANQNLARPDRVLVYDFDVTPSNVDIVYGADTRSVSSGQGQAQPDVQLGKMFATAVTGYLVQELRSNGIEAYPGSESAPPKENSDTASVRGRFVRINAKDQSTVTGFDFSDGQLRAKIQIWQGGGLGMTLVAEADTVTRTEMKSGPAPIPTTTIEADAKKTATQLAGRIIEYYKKRGWIS